MPKCLCFLAVMLATSLVLAVEPAQLEKLTEDLVSSEWSRVRNAAESMEKLPAAALPQLLTLLDRKDRVPLRNTADLIYPGAPTFYGHGYIMDYDLDVIAVRAGWVIEEITFENFGFRDNRILEERLMQYTMGRIRRGEPMFAAVPLKDAVPDVRLRTGDEIAAAVARARHWWSANAATWKRYDALIAAVGSEDPVRQLWALNWLRNGSSPCEGLESGSFDRDLRPLLGKLAANSPDERVKVQARAALESDPKQIIERHKLGTPRDGQP